MAKRRIIFLTVVMVTVLATIVGALTWYFVSRYVRMQEGLMESARLEPAGEYEPVTDSASGVTVAERNYSGAAAVDTDGDSGGVSGDESGAVEYVQRGFFDFDYGGSELCASAHFVSRTKDFEKYLSEKYLKSLSQGVLRVGFCVFDLRSGEFFALNEGENFVAASTIKLAIALLACDFIESGLLSPDDAVFYVKEYDYEGGSGVLQNYVIPGQALTVNELITLALSESDNIALNMLARKLVSVAGGGTKYAEGIKGILGRHSNLNVYTPRELLNSAMYFYENYGRRQSYAIIAEALGDTVQDGYVTGRLPKGSYIHKFGVFYGDDGLCYSCDVGIIRGENPVAFAVMTEWNIGEPYDLLNDLGETFLALAYREDSKVIEALE